MAKFVLSVLGRYIIYSARMFHMKAHASSLGLFVKSVESWDGRNKRKVQLGRSAEIVLETYDIILTEIVSNLDFDEDEGL